MVFPKIWRNESNKWDLKSKNKMCRCSSWFVLYQMALRTKERHIDWGRVQSGTQVFLKKTGFFLLRSKRQIQSKHCFSKKISFQMKTKKHDWNTVKSIPAKPVGSDITLNLNPCWPIYMSTLKKRVSNQLSLKGVFGPDMSSRQSAVSQCYAVSERLSA